MFLDIVDLTADDDADGVPNGSDCAPGDATTWGVPTSVVDLTLATSGSIEWAPPAQPGGMAPSYDVLRADGLAGLGAATCVSAGVSQSTTSDAAVPDPGGLYIYAVRASNECGSTLGTSSDGQPRVAPDCP